MLLTAIYNVSSDKIRKKVSDRLLNLGLVRVQYSVFFGTLDNNRIDELALFAEETLEESDKLYLIPIHRDNLNAAPINGHGVDDQLITDEVITKVI
jgi:CRISPR-associated protein Cas2